jgi:hypothetical protein
MRGNKVRPWELLPFCNSSKFNIVIKLFIVSNSLVWQPKGFAGCPLNKKINKLVVLPIMSEYFDNFFLIIDRTFQIIKFALLLIQEKSFVVWGKWSE